MIVARSRGVDILTQGSGNPGASNVARVLGAKWGALVFVLDAVKGALPAVVGLALDTRPGAYVLVSAAVLGHMFPATRHFHGGKGVATMAGAMLALHPIVSLDRPAGRAGSSCRKSTGKASVASLAIIVGLPDRQSRSPARRRGRSSTSLRCARWCWCGTSTTSSD